MGAQTGIAWTDHTFNPWIGCARVSPGCEHCYAEAFAKRTGMAEWGKHADRRVTSDNVRRAARAFLGDQYLDARVEPAAATGVTGRAGADTSR